MIAEPTLESLREKRDEIFAIAERHGVTDIRVFGSVAREEANPESDVDLLINMEPDRSLFDLGGFVYDLSELLRRRVDVLEEPAIHWLIRDRVLTEAVPL